MADLQNQQDYNEGKEVVPHQYYKNPPKEVVIDESGITKESGPAEPKDRKKFWIIVGASAGLVAALVAGILAGVLTRKPQNDNPGLGNKSTVTSTIGPAANMTGTSTVVSRYLFPTAVSRGYPHLEVLALTANTKYSVYRKFRNLNATLASDWKPSPSGFELVGGSIKDGSSVAVHSQSRGNLSTDIFITGADGGLYHKGHSSDNNWVPAEPDNWELMDSRTAASVPAVVAYDEPINDIFVLANSIHTSIHHFERASDGAPWNSTDLGGGNMQFTPAAVSWDGTRIDVFGVSPENNHLFHTWWDGLSWQTFNGGSAAFEDLGGFCTSSPVVISRTNGTLDVFARGGDGGLWYLPYDGKWSSWTQISGFATIQAQPDALSWTADRIDVFAWGLDNSLLTKTLNVSAGQWVPDFEFDVIGYNLTGPPKSVSDAVGSMHVFAYGPFGALIWKHWNVSAGENWPTGDFFQLGTPPS